MGSPSTNALLAACAWMLLSCGSNPDPDGRGGALTVGGTVAGALTSADDAVPPDQTAPYTSDHYTVTLSAGQQVTFEMCRCAQDLDPFLELSPVGSMPLTDDDSGGNRGARIEFTATTAGTYDLWARDCCREPVPADGQPRRYALRVVGGLQTLLSCPGPTDAPDPACP